jgi:proteasome accessory factor B
VVGFDHRSREIRTFAIDRIRRLELSDDRFDVPRSFDFDAYLGASFGVIAEPATRVRIRFDRRWATYVEEHTWHPSQSLRRGTGGSLELTMEVGGTAELLAWILSFGSGAEVLEPESLRAQVVGDLEASLARYRGASGRAETTRERRASSGTRRDSRRRS